MGGGRSGCRRAGLETGYAWILTNWMKSGFFADEGI